MSNWIVWILLSSQIGMNFFVIYRLTVRNHSSIKAWMRAVDFQLYKIREAIGMDESKVKKASFFENQKDM